MTNRGLLIVLSGPSGVGKGTVLRCLLSRRKDCVASVSATTRALRADETDSVNYHFITRQEFDRMVAAGEMLEYAPYDGHYYGTPAPPVEEMRAAGKHVFLEIEVQGALQIRQKFPDAVFIFVMPPSMRELRRRLEERCSETQESRHKRMEVARLEMETAICYDYILVNHAVEQCCTQLDAVVTAAACAVDQMKDFVQEVCSHA